MKFLPGGFVFSFTQLHAAVILAVHKHDKSAHILLLPGGLSRGGDEPVHNLLNVSYLVPLTDLLLLSAKRGCTPIFVQDPPDPPHPIAVTVAASEATDPRKDSDASVGLSRMPAEASVLDACEFFLSSTLFVEILSKLQCNVGLGAGAADCDVQLCRAIAKMATAYIANPWNTQAATASVTSHFSRRTAAVAVADPVEEMLRVLGALQTAPRQVKKFWDKGTKFASVAFKVRDLLFDTLVLQRAYEFWFCVRAEHGTYFWHMRQRPMPAWQACHTPAMRQHAKYGMHVPLLRQCQSCCHIPLVACLCRTASFKP